MLAHPTQERLLALGLAGMARAFDDQRRQPDVGALSFEERFALLLDRETMERQNKRLVTRLRFAALRQDAVVEDVERVRRHPLVPRSIPIYGYVYDVTSGQLIEVEGARKAGAAQ